MHSCKVVKYELSLSLSHYHYHYHYQSGCVKTTLNGDVGMKCNFQEKTREGADQRVGRGTWGSSTWLAWQPGGVHAADYEVGLVMVMVMNGEDSAGDEKKVDGSDGE